MELKEQIAQAVEEQISGTSTFLVEVRTSPSKIAVFVDNMLGLKLEECVEISRALETKPELISVFETHELEVSSPGMDEPLRVLKQYEKRIGQEVTVLLKNGNRKNGILKSATPHELILVESFHEKLNGKKILQTREHQIQLAEAKETKVVFNYSRLLREK